MVHVQYSALLVSVLSVHRAGNSPFTGISHLLFPGNPEANIVSLKASFQGSIHQMANSLKTSTGSLVLLSLLEVSGVIWYTPSMLFLGYKYF